MRIVYEFLEKCLDCSVNTIQNDYDVISEKRIQRPHSKNKHIDFSVLFTVYCLHSVVVYINVSVSISISKRNNPGKCKYVKKKNANMFKKFNFV